MTEHRGPSFYNSCVKVPVDPCSKQPIPFYERFKFVKNDKDNSVDSKNKINLIENDQFKNESKISNSKKIIDSFLEFLESIPDYGQVHHLSNEQFNQKIDYLKRKQRSLLENLQNTFTDHENISISKHSVSKSNKVQPKIKSKSSINDLKVDGKKSCLEGSRVSSPMLFHSDKFDELAEDKDLLTNGYIGKGTRSNEVYEEKLYLTHNDLRTLSGLSNDDSVESDIDNIETRSLPTSITKEWHPTVPKPFSFTLREEAEKYMTYTEMEKKPEYKNLTNNTKRFHRKRGIKSIPLTSKLPLYNKLLAEKEERSRIIREESTFNLMSQIRPFRLECDRRAWRCLARSNPEIHSRSVTANTKFKAKPVPKNLFSTAVYDRMLEDEYYRQLQKKMRAAQLMKSASLPPSMARRERVMATCTRSRNIVTNCNEKPKNEDRSISRLSSNISIPVVGYRSMMSLLPLRGNNLAAILRCQMSREKLEHEIREKMEEKRREQAMKIRESLIRRNPIWKALRSAARYEHERDLSIRTSLRRNEAREQAERHRIQMEMMVDRVTQIPTLFERYSQSYQSLIKTQQKGGSKMFQRKKKKKQFTHTLNSVGSYIDCANVSRPNSGSMSSFSATPQSTSQSSKSSNTNASKSSNTDASKLSKRSTIKSQGTFPTKKGDRSQLKVSINETAELIEDQDENEKLFGNDHSFSDEHGKNIFRYNERNKEK